MDESKKAEGIDRRTALKRGLVVVAATVWVTPAVQVLGLGERYAQAASGPGPKPAPEPKPKPKPKPKPRPNPKSSP